MSEFISNELIEASAGTGKTQALAERLIDLMKERKVKPQEIVALTFSRAAAGEIFERFVSLLADRNEAALLREVIATQHLTQIGTLDAFLMRIVRAFPLELGLRGELRLLDDYEAMSEMNRISFSILRRTDAKTSRTFTDAFALAMNHENVRSFVETYRKFIKNWHDLVTANPESSSWGDAEQIWGEQVAFAQVGERELEAAADGVERIADSPLLHEFAKWVRSFRGSLSNTKGLAKKLLELGNIFAGDSIEFSYSNKTIAYVGEKCAAVRTAMMCIFGYVIRMKLELARGIYAVISAYEREYAKKVRDEGRLVFADVPRLIASLGEDARLALEYRLDSRISAWALDEFQDTSREQWRAISPLIDAAKQSAGEKSVFVVGDCKQAIYGWRNGDVRIFEGERDGGLYHTRPLVKSWRFGPAITEAVNRVFSGGMIAEEFPAWHSPLHESAKPELKGFVQKVECTGDKMDDFTEPVYNALKAVDPVGRGISAAVLVRTNPLGEKVADGLKRMGLKGVVWEGESDVMDTPALSAFLDLVQLADHPGDMLTYRHFLLSPIATAKYPNGVPTAAEVSNEFSKLFTTRGIVRVFRELRSLFPEDPSIVWNESVEARFTEMLRAAAEFELLRNPDSRLADFPRYLAAKRRRTLAEPGTIKVMTIHRSKGLGFDYVVLPLYEHEALNAEPDRPLVGEGWVLPKTDFRVVRAVGGLSAAYNERRDRAEQEALCLYYVAMTRAKQALTIILHPALKGTSDAVRFSNIVRESLPAEIGERDWYLERKIKSDSDDAESMPSPAVCSRSVVRSPRQNLRRRLPSKRYQSGQSAGLLFISNAPNRKAMERGTAVHAALEAVDFNEWIVKPDGFTALWKERAFEVVVEDTWVSGRFDRVVFMGRKAVIQDFKTGRNVDPNAYCGQMLTYRRALSALTAIPERDIALELLLVDRQEVVRL